MEKQIAPMLTCNHTRIINFIDMYVQDKEPKDKLLRGLTLLFYVPLCVIEMLEFTHETINEALQAKELLIYNSASKKTDIYPLSTDAIKDIKALFQKEETGKVFKNETEDSLSFLLNSFIKKCNTKDFSIQSYNIGLHERKKVDT